MTKALFFDIDGTLVSFNTHAIPASTIEAIAKAKEKGIKVFISTGRAKAIINNLGTLEFDGYITMNGAYCFAGKNEVIYKNSIPVQDVETMVSIVKKRKLTCIFVAEKKMMIANPNWMSDEFSVTLKTPILPQVNPDQVLGMEIFQMSPFITPAQERELMMQLPHCESGRWHPSFTDIVAVGSGKHNGIDAIIKHFDIRLDETMAFGDGGNDISMLKHAAIGVAMGNAGENVKQVADYVTDTVDKDGIMKALKHFNVIDS
ncbi:Cof-type HAD-IIB family hydrolase [Bacteroides sp. OttesenSCG-928-J23]|nr:Cof-type HAD-IIB family hydrolase [Bacteroides sp. OttesenSCG-928-N06]MDL2247462.1 Cof-type HAD-IIB family hydrolase [Bacteroides sp. OttesenSCG-928-J23]MDL2299627.1 Cof-type HAD-IIB family hydrolase [Bacteroides sp. OttesenSCG-928-E20]MDL2305733.1 Cof-type HAD-IIB family hydrolase [Bacteroides sp. OttesenSCG-928-D19]